MPNASAKPPARSLAPHVQAAVGRIAQARMAEPKPGFVRQMAPHVAAALRGAAQPKMAPQAVAALRGAVQPKTAPHVQAAVRSAAQPKMAPHVPAAARGVAQRKSAPDPGKGTIQRMMSLFKKKEEELPKNITGEDRSTETVTTAGGVWTAVRYVAVERLNHAPACGAFMHLDFTPVHPTDATKIALVQTVLPYKNGQLYYTDETLEKRASGTGAAIDQHEESRSPLYADVSGTGGLLLGSSATQQDAGRHGYRFFDQKDNRWKWESARLKDTPHFREVRAFSSQTFETTALAVEGNDRGTYYGSVRWGWRSDGKGKVQLDKLSVVSNGSVSGSFKLALRQWNATKTSTGVVPQQLPEVTPPSEKPENPTFTAITNDML